MNYGENYSNKKITEIGIAETERIQAIGKFGLGTCQWTEPSRAKLLLESYKEVCGDDNYPSLEQVYQVEALCLVSELRGDTEYGQIYSSWQNCGNKLAYEAGKIFCIDFERPKDKYNEAVKRGKEAENIYYYMIGED